MLWKTANVKRTIVQSVDGCHFVVNTTVEINEYGELTAEYATLAFRCSFDGAIYSLDSMWTGARTTSRHDAEQAHAKACDEIRNWQSH